MTEENHCHSIETTEKWTAESQAFEKLAQLLEQHQFEWLPDGRVVFLMNDAVESFLVFENARMTGEFDSDYDGELDAQLEQIEGEYLLIVRQGGKNTFTIRFSGIRLEATLYNYGEIGHFWVEGQEDIRQLEYRLAILRDKWFYLGEAYCSEAEKQLVHLAEFPPIMTRYAVPLKYIDVPENPWKVTGEAIDAMKVIALEAGDQRLGAALEQYRKYAGKGNRFIERLMGMYLAKQLTQSSHTETVLLLAEKIRHASERYPNRDFGENVNEQYQRLWKKGCEMAREQGSQRKSVMALREEPFVEAPDDIDYKVYLMKTECRGRRRIIEVERIRGNRTDVKE